MAIIARLAILGLVLAMGLADNIVNMAFGFGERDAAKTVADCWASRSK